MKSIGFAQVFTGFSMVVGSPRELLGPMLGDVGYKIGPRGTWIRNFANLGELGANLG